MTLDLEILDEIATTDISQPRTPVFTTTQSSLIPSNSNNSSKEIKYKNFEMAQSGAVEIKPILIIGQ